MSHEHVDTRTVRRGMIDYAIVVCSCGWESEPGGRDEVASQFEEHVTKGQALRDLFA